MSKTGRRHMPEENIILAYESKTVCCLDCNLAFEVVKVNSKLVYLHPKTNFCKSNGKMFEIPTLPLTEVSD